jgi:hypothetical protein
MEYTNKYVKILHESMKHKGFKYQLGLNTDHIPFNPFGSCGPGGLYFTDLANFYKFLDHGTLIADVEVPEDVEIYADPDGDKWKSPSIIISNVRSIKDLPQWKDLAFWVGAVQQDGYALEFVPDEFKTEVICLAAVRQKGFSLRYVPDRLETAEICLDAVQQNGYALQYVFDDLKTEEICLAAVRQNASAIYYIPDNLRAKVFCMKSNS